MSNSAQYRPWINFKELRAKLHFEDVLRHYKVQVHRKGNQHQGPCPLPGHTGSKTASSFSANLERGIFRCFGCKAEGNVLDFAALMEGADPADGKALREVAVDLQRRFYPEGASGRTKRNETTHRSIQTLVNEPLDFTLKGLDAGHGFFKEIGVSVETADFFGAGYTSRGLLAERIAIPLHDEEGKLVGYAGRAVDEASVSEDSPLYLFPSKRERTGKILDFDRCRLLYGLHLLKGAVDEVVVTADFVAVWKLREAGCPPALATMADGCSEQQVEFLLDAVKPDGRVWVLSESTKDGEAFAQEMVFRLAPHRFVRWVAPGSNAPFVALSCDEIKRCFTQ